MVQFHAKEILTCRMHGDPNDTCNSEPPGRDKRSLHAATDGSPHKPDAKFTRGNDELDLGPTGEATEAAKASDTIRERCELARGIARACS